MGTCCCDWYSRFLRVFLSIVETAKYQVFTPFETVCLLANSMNLLSKINDFAE